MSTRKHKIGRTDQFPSAVSKTFYDKAGYFISKVVLKSYDSINGTFDWLWDFLKWVANKHRVTRGAAPKTPLNHLVYK